MYLRVSCDFHSNQFVVLIRTDPVFRETRGDKLKTVNEVDNLSLRVDRIRKAAVLMLAVLRYRHTYSDLHFMLRNFTSFFGGGCEGPRSRRYGRTAALRLIVQPCDEDD